MRSLWVRIALFSVFGITLPGSGAPGKASAVSGEQLRFIVVLSRHGVRSPTGDANRYYEYSNAPWPEWSVPPGYLTAHGYRQMLLVGAWDRRVLAKQGLIASDGCGDAAGIVFYADSDQRTRESARAMAEGMFPGCPSRVVANPEGTRDALFHPLAAGASPPDPIAARGVVTTSDPRALTEVWHPQLAALDHILATCGTPAAADHRRISLFDIPDKPEGTRSDHPRELRGPMGAAATITENLQLEYTEGMPAQDVGWGCVRGESLRDLIGLHTAAAGCSQRTPAAAYTQASNLLEHVLLSMEQAVTGRSSPEALTQPGDRALFLIGHDTNITNVAGLLSLDWTADGRRDDVPPGAALVFELWRNRTSGRYYVRTWYTAQTLEQIRSGQELSDANPPERVPLSLGSCGKSKDEACSWEAFARTLRDVVDPAFVRTRETKAKEGN